MHLFDLPNDILCHLLDMMESRCVAMVKNAEGFMHACRRMLADAWHCWRRRCSNQLRACSLLLFFASLKKSESLLLNVHICKRSTRDQGVNDQYPASHCRDAAAMQCVSRRLWCLGAHVGTFHLLRTFDDSNNADDDPDSASVVAGSSSSGDGRTLFFWLRQQQQQQHSRVYGLKLLGRSGD